MTSIGQNAMTNVLSTNIINGLTGQKVKQIYTDKINNIEFNEDDINLKQINLDDKYKIDLSNGNFTITQTLPNGTQNEVLKHDKNSGEVSIPGFNQNENDQYSDLSGINWRYNITISGDDFKISSYLPTLMDSSPQFQDSIYYPTPFYFNASSQEAFIGGVSSKDL